MKKEQLTIALSKGRILKETLPLLERANIIPSEDVVFSKKAVKIIQEPNIEVDGVGMKYDKKENTIKLLSNVKVHYEKPKK